MADEVKEEPRFSRHLMFSVDFPGLQESKEFWQAAGRYAIEKDDVGFKALEAAAEKLEEAMERMKKIGSEDHHPPAAYRYE